jgi:hypothetical protein
MLHLCFDVLISLEVDVSGYHIAKMDGRCDPFAHLQTFRLNTLI